MSGFFAVAMQLVLIGILGEYMLSINTRTMKKTCVVVEERINFDDPADERDMSE